MLCEYSSSISVSILFAVLISLCTELDALSCPALCDPIDYSPPSSPVRGDSAGKNTGVGCHGFL